LSARKRLFGPLDPFCLMAVLPMLLVAGLVGALASVAAALGFVAVAGLILVFDSWANRPAPAPRSRPRPRVQRAPTPVRHPRQAPRPAAYRPPGPAPRRAPGGSYR
jgi:hypothetical protein